jgi:hypothetical protein
LRDAGPVAPIRPGDRVVWRFGPSPVQVVADVRGAWLVWPERVVPPEGYLPHEVPARDYVLASGP